MNLILLFPEDMHGSGRARVTGRRLRHVLDVHRAGVGDELIVGMANGLIGSGTVIGISESLLEMEVSLLRKPPPPVQLTMILALPRPKVLRRVLFTLAVLGVKKIILINSHRVEKSYWQTPFLREVAVQRQLVLGLEQARDTVLPEVLLRERFKPFTEDELPFLMRESAAFLSHPYAEQNCPRGIVGKVILAVGPEGGFLPYEVDKFQSAGFLPVTLGERILNIENAVPLLITMLS